MDKEIKNLWISILRHPYLTFEALSDQNIKRWHMFIISYVVGTTSILTRFYLKNASEYLSLSSIIIIAILLGPISGYIRLIIGAFLAKIIGKLFKGKATYDQMLIVNVWSSVPIILTIPIWVIEIIVFGPSLFTEDPYNSISNWTMGFLFIALSFIEFLLEVWSFIIFTIGFCKYHEFKKIKYLFYILNALFLGILTLFIVATTYVDIDTIQFNKNVNQENYDVLLDEVNEKLEKTPDNIELQNEKAFLLISNGELKKGLNLIDLILKKDPVNDTALNNKGWALNELGRYEEAVQVLKKSLSIEPNDAYEYNNLGNAFLNLEEYESAIDAYESVIEFGVTKDFEDVYYGLGVAYYYIEYYEESVNNLQKYLTFVPKDINTYWYMVYAYDESKKTQNAIDTVDKIIKIDPSDIEAYTYKGDILLYSYNEVEALKVYEEIIEMFPEDPHGYYGKAQVLSLQNKSTEAISYLRASFSFDPYYSEYAFTDPVFDPIRESEAFEELISEFSEEYNYIEKYL
ncbi:MAG TPA: tetratricopeptide repeat protein [Bacillus bacterium]|nr:tetratricopeptide repeat protein [Bacillus sp. (in: firmicutes)]